MSEKIKATVRPVAPFENQPKLKRTQKTAKEHSVGNTTSRKGVSKNRESKSITPITIVIEETRSVVNTPVTKKSNVSKANIEKGRQRKQELQNIELTPKNFATLKKQNLKELVAEYEAERAEYIAQITNDKDINFFGLIILYTLQTHDYLLTQKEFDKSMRRQTKKYYRKQFLDMVKSYAKYLGMSQPKDTPIISINSNDTNKMDNLNSLVQEYEIERAIVAKKRKNILDSLHIVGMIKTDDAITEQCDENLEMSRSTEEYYRNIEKQMIKNYKAIDIAKRAEQQADIVYAKQKKQHNSNKKVQIYDVGLNPTPHQLRTVVHSFNNQHKL